MKKKLPSAICIIVLLITMIVGVVFRMGQEQRTGLILVYKGQETVVRYDAIPKEPFSGELVDGKGDCLQHHYQGVELQLFLREIGVDIDTVAYVEIVSADQYAARVAGEELRQEQRVYLAVEADGELIEGIDAGTEGGQLIVFGDTDSKRCVRFVQYLYIS